jgi:hypothetical protein
MAEVGRLTRCQVLFDDRDEIEIREALRERLRHYRNSSRSGLGQESAGLLTGYLVSEILRRAADASQAVFTIDQLRSHVLVSAEDLARVSGVRDWGIIVGAMPKIPDVARPVLLNSLVQALAGPATTGVQGVALVGPSGIGKSSLAAAYIADHADSYNWIFWVNCEAEESILASFRNIAAFLSGNNLSVNYHDSPEYLRQAVHTELSRIVGQWLIIFDNVADMGRADAWMPRAGTGDVIITSIDSAARRSFADSIEVGTMELTEAAELLSRHFKLTTNDREQHEKALCRLAEELSCWPLALELASGYMDSCGIGLDGVGYYLGQLKIRSLADVDSVPRGYPRTLVAAVSLCLERVHNRLGLGGNTGEHAYLGLGMITSAAFLASRQLPCHMLAAAVVMDPPAESGPGMWVIDPSEANIGEAVRELRRISLVSFDQDLPAMGNAVYMVSDIGRTITMNTVIQEIIRADVEDSEDTHRTLNRLANHVERWLVVALDLNHLDRASALFPHAEILADHIRRLGIADRRAALLYGNLAGAYRARGQLDKAVEYLIAELDVARSGEDNDDVLVPQAKLALADIYFDDLGDLPIDLTTVVSYINDVAEKAASLRHTYPNAAMKLALDAKTIIDRPAARSANANVLTVIERRLDKIASDIGPTEYSEAMLALRKANKLLSKQRFSMVERLCIRVLTSGSMTGNAELEARRLLVETLVHERRWQEALDAHRIFRQHFGSTRLYIPIITRYAHNVGLACAIPALSEAVSDGIALLDELLGWPVVSEAIELPSTGSQFRLRLLSGILSLVRCQYKDAASILATVPPIELREGTPDETKAWCNLWQMARLAIFREVSLRYSEIAATQNK